MVDTANVLLAREIVVRRHGATHLLHRWPWMVAFGFGLLHGLGFAGALGRIGLRREDIPGAPLFFNLGVAAGRLAFVAAVLAAQRTFPAMAAGGVALAGTRARLFAGNARDARGSSSGFRRCGARRKRDPFEPGLPGPPRNSGFGASPPPQPLELRALAGGEEERVARTHQVSGPERGRQDPAAGMFALQEPVGELMGDDTPQCPGHRIGIRLDGRAARHGASIAFRSRAGRRRHLHHGCHR